MPNRMISLERNTNETQIDLTLEGAGPGAAGGCRGGGPLWSRGGCPARGAGGSAPPPPGRGGGGPTTPPTPWALHWVRPLHGRWAICAVSSATAAFICPWMKR